MGLGAIGSTVAKNILGGKLPNVQVAAVLTQTKKDPANELGNDAEGRVGFFSEEENSVDGFFAADWDLCVEAAGQPAVRKHALRVLESPGANRRLLLTSIGALTDDALYAKLQEAAAVQGAGPRLLLCSGSMPALDWLSAACFSVDEAEAAVVTCSVTQMKPPKSWKGTPAEKTHDLDAITEYTTLYEGTAREAATLFPKNSNVACTLALTTIGLDRTMVKLVTDPNAPPGKNMGAMVNFSSPSVGEISLEVKARMSPENPKTSAVVPLSVLKTLKNLSQPVAVGV